MVDLNYSARQRDIKKVEYNVKQAICRLQPEDLNSNDLVDYLSKLKDITVLK